MDLPTEIGQNADRIVLTEGNKPLEQMGHFMARLSSLAASKHSARSTELFSHRRQVESHSESCRARRHRAPLGRARSLLSAHSSPWAVQPRQGARGAFGPCGVPLRHRPCGRW
jgi:hypothetical protein